MSTTKIATPAIIREVAARMGCHRKDARELLEHFAAVVIENIAGGRKVQFSGLGVFIPQPVVRGPRAGKALRVKFRPAKEFLRQLQKGVIAKETD
jgi:nucleoid DNA-binding protein